MTYKLLAILSILFPVMNFGLAFFPVRSGGASTQFWPLFYWVSAILSVALGLIAYGKPWKIPSLVGIILGLLCLAPGLLRLAMAGASPCTGDAPQLVADTESGLLFLCEPSQPPRSFPISIGRGGKDKRLQGDHKTPLGIYPLGPTRTSSKFHLFVPILYPSPDQKSEGYSGGDVGIHGPPRWIAWAGALTRLLNWTDGCIAVGTDDEIEAVARWIEGKHPSTIDIR